MRPVNGRLNLLGGSERFRCSHVERTASRINYNSQVITERAWTRDPFASQWNSFVHLASAKR